MSVWDWLGQDCIENLMHLVLVLMRFVIVIVIVIFIAVVFVFVVVRFFLFLVELETFLVESWELWVDSWEFREKGKKLIEVSVFSIFSTWIHILRTIFHFSLLRSLPSPFWKNHPSNFYASIHKRGTYIVHCAYKHVCVHLYVSME